MIDAVGRRVVIVALAGWVHRHQLQVIEYLREENRVLKEHLDGRRLRLNFRIVRVRLSEDRLFAFMESGRLSIELIGYEERTLSALATVLELRMKQFASGSTRSD